MTVQDLLIYLANKPSESEVKILNTSSGIEGNVLTVYARPSDVEIGEEPDKQIVVICMEW